MLRHGSLRPIRFPTLAHLTNILPLYLISTPAHPSLLIIRIILRKILKGCNDVSQLSFLLQGKTQLHAEAIVGRSQFANFCCVEIDSLFDIAVEGVDGNQLIRRGGVTGTGLFADYAWNDDDIAFGALL